jgi:hypothetical protein
MKSLLVVAAIAAVLVQPALAAGADVAPFTLLCKANVQGQLFTRNLVVDYGRKTVNGVPASITDTMITWSSKEEVDSLRRQGVVNRHELNRLSGTYRFGQEGAVYASPLPSYNCEKAPPPKF